MATIDAKKKKIVAEIIRQLHQGLPVEKAKERILREVGTLSSVEITDIEQSLIDEGVSPDEIKRFCNVHALLFESALEQTVATPESSSHPVNLLRRENREIEKIVAGLKLAVKEMEGPGRIHALAAVKTHMDRLAGVDRHYAIKENAIFPYLEKNGFPGPSKVMWGKHNEVRDMMKKAAAGLASGSPDTAALSALATEIEGMIFKEENILFPAALERISVKEWVEILRACDEIGYPYIHGPGLHDTLQEAGKLEDQAAAIGTGEIVLPTGRFSLDELTATLNALPIDITFVDAEDRVKYFSQSKDRLFVRAKSVIGRSVENCHPPQSVHKVKEIVEAFKNGSRDHADFWIRLHGKLVYIRYFAVRDPDRKYLGTLEVTQDLTEIMKLEGERRLLDDRG
jgi:DUF438 domain-containing protein